MYLGVRVKAEDLFQLADKAVDLMDETAAIELTVRMETYEIVANSPSDLIAALGEDDCLARSASLTVNSSRGSIRLDISPQRGVGTVRLFLHVRHEVPDTANALFDEASTLLRRRVCGKKGGFPHVFLYTQALVLFLLSAAGRALFLHPTWADVWWILGISLFALLVEHLIFDPGVTLRPRPARPQRRFWQPSEASVARWTVIAGVLAIPALLIGVVALFTG
jgi:hypothetical protein